MRAGFNPTRRNRNIGTARQGHGQNNRLTIPVVSADQRRWTEQLGSHQQYQRSLAGRSVNFIVEDTFGGCRHACTVEDVLHVLAHLPPADWAEIETFVLRQSTRKRRLLRPAWGRMYYFAHLGAPGRGTTRPGPAVMLEATDIQRPLRWSAALDPQDAAELERLRADGHKVLKNRRGYEIIMTSDSVRATQLYRTLLHEIGHWVDYLQKVERPADAGQGDWDALDDAYFARPRAEREAFAHRYADEMAAKLFEDGVFPFAPIAYLTRKAGARRDEEV